MASIIQMPAAHFSFEKRGGYNVVLPEIIAQFFEYLRGIGPDAFIIKRYFSVEGQEGLCSMEIMRGCVPTDHIDRQSIHRHQTTLEEQLGRQAINARSYINRDSRIYQNREHGNNVVFVKCRDGLMGCGWYDSAHTERKGLKMAAFMLYALGAINKEDETLITAVYNYLPYDSALTTEETNKASGIIVKVLTANKALGPTHRFTPLKY